MIVFLVSNVYQGAEGTGPEKKRLYNWLQLKTSKDPNFFRHDFSFKLLTHDAYLLQSSLLVNAMPLSFRCHCKKSPHYSNSRKKGSRSLIRNLSSRNINYLFGLYTFPYHYATGKDFIFSFEKTFDFFGRPLAILLV